jgi:hypothetical protein
MLILDGTIGSDIHTFLARLKEETISCRIMLYEEWVQQYNACDHNHDHELTHNQPEGIIYLRVLPEIAHVRLHKRTSEVAAITLEQIQQIYTEKERLFIENKNAPIKLQALPVLVLNGNIDFQVDFAQFYNHLFYIRRLIKQIQEKKDIALGIYKEKIPHRHCC